MELGGERSRMNQVGLDCGLQEGQGGNRVSLLGFRDDECALVYTFCVSSVV